MNVESHACCDLGYLSTNSWTPATAVTSTNSSSNSSTWTTVFTPSTSPCVGNCQTSVPGCDVRGPTTQTGMVTITDINGDLVPVPCRIYISLWNDVQASKDNKTATNATTITRPITRSSTVYPPFIYDLKSSIIGSCDVFGAICQTGTMEAVLNLTSTLSMTTVACSDYLQAQREAVMRFGSNLDRDKYATTFGRSPQCSSFSKRIALGQVRERLTETYSVLPGATRFNAAYYSSVIKDNYAFAGYTLSGTSQIPPKPTPLAGCPANASEFDSDLYPGGIRHSLGVGRTWNCCGWCNLHAPELQIFYFPDGSGLVNSGFNATNTTRTGPQSGLHVPRKRADPLPNKAPVTAVVSGYT